MRKVDTEGLRHAYQPKPPGRSDFGIALIGLGYGAFAHIPAYLKAGWKLRAIADKDAARLEEVGSRFGLEGRYQVGVILLGSPQSPEWNHLYKLGRIPILSFKARIVDGKKLDEQVSYPLPNQTLFTIFLKNNPFYRLWLQRSSSKSADGAQPRPPAASPPR